MDKKTGYALNGGQIYTEVSGIIVLLLKETDMFQSMTEDEVKETMICFATEYASLRNRSESRTLDDFECDSPQFKKYFLQLLRKVNDAINSRSKPQLQFLSLKKIK
ncbi:MAG: hypothetical protein HZB09_01955 [Candidatus Yonathbacteria bacterium]|nr:hypothetical protein [Candidatus Yonathbacteria bacterium]